MQRWLAMLAIVLSACALATPNDKYVITKRLGATSFPTDAGSGATALAFSSNDDSATTISTPFNIALFDQLFASGANASVSTNGFIQFFQGPGTGATNFSNGMLPASIGGVALFPLWDDLIVSGFGNGVWQSVNGSAPNRTWAITWVSLRGTSPVKFSIVFFEQATHFDVHYPTAWPSNLNATIGVQESTVGRVTQLPSPVGNLGNALTSADWLNLAGGNANGFVLRFNFVPACSMDIDGDGQINPNTDSLVHARIAAGLTGNAVVANATAGNVRTSWEAIRDYLVAACGWSIEGYSKQ
jgi:hypothetical protein